MPADLMVKPDVVATEAVRSQCSGRLLPSDPSLHTEAPAFCSEESQGGSPKLGIDCDKWQRRMSPK